jgi:hypothetical protein
MPGVGCWTGYLVRDVDGACRYAVRKRGAWLLTSDETRAAVLADVRRNGVPVADVTPGSFSGWCCHGVAIDVPGRRYRCFACQPRFVRNETADRAVRAAAIWQDWDAGFARGGREEFVEVIREAAGVVAPYAAPTFPLAELALADRDGWFAGWDETAFELAVWDDEYSANWTDAACDLLTVIDADLAVRDYRLANGHSDVDQLLPWLGYGDRLLDGLTDAAPYPLPTEHDASSGAVVDLPRRVLHYWSERFVPPRVLDSVRSAWPDWQIKRLEYGLAEHLAVTGRQVGELLDSAGLVASDEAGFVADDAGIVALGGAGVVAWDGARRSRPIDPRPFQVPRIAVRER